jgi:signal transduction histidine kinase
VGRPDTWRVHLETYVRVGRAADARSALARYREAVTTRLHRLGAWFDGLNPWVADGAVAVLFAIIGLLTTSGRGDTSRTVYEPQDALGVVLVLAASLPFVFRRRYPLSVLLFCTGAVVVNSLLGHNEGATPFFLWVAVITVAATCSTPKVILGAVWIFVGLLVLVLSEGSALGTSGFALQCAVFAAIFMFGINLKNRRARIDALEERARALEREKEEEARRAVADERLHIARELHDVVAHSMGVIAVQASVGEHVIDADPVEAKRALAAISDVSRTTLTEIRRLLGVLRAADNDEGGAPAYAPAPGLADLDRLVRELADAGLPVTVHADGTRVELPRGVDLTAYRIVQEALTNVLKHAGPAAAQVCVHYSPGALGLEVVDDGRGVNGRADGQAGHGLVGMRERVAVYGGTLECGPRAGGGFRVAVTLPYEVTP